MFQSTNKFMILFTPINKIVLKYQLQEIEGGKPPMIDHLGNGEIKITPWRTITGGALRPCFM